jgi:hypothetical protein
MDDKIASFKSKWALFLEEGESAADDFRPMIGLDACDPKPYSLYGNYEV